MNIEEIAKKMVSKGRGILAADESTGTMDKRLKSVNIENNAKNRLNFRETLFSSKSMKESISGVIIFDETIRQKTTSGKTIPELITNKVIVKKGEVITSVMIEKKELDYENINSTIKNLLRKTRDKIKFRGSIVNEITTRGDFIKKIRDSLKINKKNIISSYKIVILEII